MTFLKRAAFLFVVLIYLNLRLIYEWKLMSFIKKYLDLYQLFSLQKLVTFSTV